MEAWWVLGGAAVGGGISLLGERFRARWSDRTRWLDTRRQLAVGYLQASEEVVKSIISMRDTQRANLLDPTVSVASEDARVATAVQRLDELRVEIDLVGSEEERAAAKRLRDAAANLDRALAGLRGTGEEGRERYEALRDANHEYEQAREAFREAARAGLVPKQRGRRFLARSR
jgi:small-conductance mechanosensitive channel